MKDPTFLKTMVKRVGARRVLEIGTFDGTSAIAMAETLPDDGTLITCEINPGFVALARKRLSRSPYGHKIDVLVGPALEILPTLAGRFDLIFVDADTKNYVQYYRQGLELLAPAGALLLDNTRGMTLGAVDPAADPAIAAIQELRQLVTADRTITADLVPVRDGVLVVTKHPPA